MEILRVSGLILENCSNKYCYNSVEFFISLLKHDNLDVVVATLQLLYCLARKSTPLNRHMTSKWQGHPALTACLLPLAQGCGTLDDGLGLIACAADGVITSTEGGVVDRNLFCKGTSVAFEFFKRERHTINVEDVPEQGDLRQLFKSLLSKDTVPDMAKFVLYSRLRFAYTFNTLEGRRQAVRAKLLALFVLLLSRPDESDISQIFSSEPGLRLELVNVVSSPERIPDDIRALAMNIMSISVSLQRNSQEVSNTRYQMVWLWLVDFIRLFLIFVCLPFQDSILNTLGAGGQRGILASLVEHTISKLLDQADKLYNERDGSPELVYREHNGFLVFVESMLTFIHYLASPHTAYGVISSCNLISTLMPLLTDKHPSHRYLVTGFVRTLETIVDFLSTSYNRNPNNMTSFDMIIERLYYEVTNIISTRGTQAEMQKTMKREEITQIGYSSRTLIRSLLRAIQVADIYSLFFLSLSLSLSLT